MTRVTVVVLIGNSDDKLSQLEWAKFIDDLDEAINQHRQKMYHAGYSEPKSMYQNTSRVFDMAVHEVMGLRTKLGILAKNYKQESIALVIGQTELVPAWAAFEG